MDEQRQLHIERRHGKVQVSFVVESERNQDEFTPEILADFAETIASFFHEALKEEDPNLALEVLRTLFQDAHYQWQARLQR